MMTSPTYSALNTQKAKTTFITDSSVALLALPASIAIGALPACFFVVMLFAQGNPFALQGSWIFDAGSLEHSDTSQLTSSTPAPSKNSGSPDYRELPRLDSSSRPPSNRTGLVNVKISQPMAAEYDVFTTVDTGQGSETIESFLTITDQHLALLAEMTQGTSRVHILSNDAAFLERIRRVASSLQRGSDGNHVLVAEDVNAYFENVRGPFLKIYKHQSTRGRGWESHNLFRWGLYHVYMQRLRRRGYTLKKIWTIDIDVVPVRPYSQWLPIEVERQLGHGKGYLDVYDAATVLWTPRKLDHYWMFIQGLYKTQQRTEWLVSNFGKKAHCELHLGIQAEDCASEVIPPHKDGWQYTVGDMTTMLAYKNESTDYIQVWRADHFKGKQSDEGSGYYCYHAFQRDFHEDDWELRFVDGPDDLTNPKNSKGWNIFLPGLFKPACTIHFQSSAKRLIPQLCSLFFSRNSGSKMRFCQNATGGYNWNECN